MFPSIMITLVNLKLVLLKLIFENCLNAEFETILTTVELERKDKKSFILPSEENERIEKILKKAKDKETGKLTDVSLTEDNPDGRKLK